MVNREKALRDSYFSILNGNLSYNSTSIPISDLKLNSEATLYVLFGAQNGQDEDTLSYQSWNCNFEIMIVHKQLSSVSRDILDDVSQQIEDLVIGSSPSFKGLAQQTGWQITLVNLLSTHYLNWQLENTSSPVVKVLQFSQKMIKV